MIDTCEFVKDNKEEIIEEVKEENPIKIDFGYIIIFCLLVLFTVFLIIKM